MDPARKTEILSKKTRAEFREAMKDLWVLRQITTEFDSAGIEEAADYDAGESGQRRSLIERYYHTLDFSLPTDVERVLAVFGAVLDGLKGSADNRDRLDHEYAKKALPTLLRFLEKDGFTFKDGRVVSLAHVRGLPKMKEVALKFDAPYVLKQIERMENAVHGDPGLAIGTAKELVETTCKTILRERKIQVESDWDVLDLVKNVRQALDLVPDAVPESAKASKTIKTLLNNLGTIVQGLAELRNPYGTGHGPDGKAQGLQPRHARLAVGAATTLATFLFETHHDRQEDSSKSSK